MVFASGGEKRPLDTIAERAICPKSFKGVYFRALWQTDGEAGAEAAEQKSTAASFLGNWRYQVTLYQHVMWPLKVSEIPSSLVSRMDTISNTYIRKWLGLPRCFSDAGLFDKNALHLPLKSMIPGYKQEKTRLVFELKESRDEAVKSAGVIIRTGRRWRAQQEVDQAVNRLQHKEVMGRVQHSRAGLGWGEPVQFWSKAKAEEVHGGGRGLTNWTGPLPHHGCFQGQTRSIDPLGGHH